MSLPPGAPGHITTDPEDPAPARRLSGGAKRAGLRVRTASSFALGALLVASIMAGLTFAIARAHLIDQRESGALRQSYLNARLVRDALDDPAVDVADLLTSLRADGRSEVAVLVGGRWFSTSVAVSQDSIPASLRTVTASEGAGRQLITVDGTPTLVNGVALPGASASYYELFPLLELDATLSAIRTALIVSAAIATAVGAASGLFVSRRVLLPLRQVAVTANDIATGRIDRRLDASGDPDLSLLTDSFNSMVDALQTRIRREARFSSDVSHELRSPLATLSAAIGIAKRRRDALPPDVGDLVDVIDDQVQRFQSLTVDLLEIARVDAGSADLHLEQLDPEIFVRRCLDSYDHPIDVVVEGELRPVVADKRRLRQVVTNLVTNATKYGGGADRVVVSDGPHHTIRLSVEDRGPGVAPEEREEIFGRFSRGRVATSQPELRGSGLGLALAREHVSLLQGRLWVEDREGGGARFIIELPAEVDGHEPIREGLWQ